MVRDCEELAEAGSGWLPKTGVECWVGQALLKQETVVTLREDYLSHVSYGKPCLLFILSSHVPRFCPFLWCAGAGIVLGKTI